MNPDKTKRKSWMTDEILELMEERRKVKNKENEYRTINNIIKKKIREAKEQEVKEKRIEIEALQNKHDSFN